MSSKLLDTIDEAVSFCGKHVFGIPSIGSHFWTTRGVAVCGFTRENAHRDIADEIIVCICEFYGFYVEQLRSVSQSENQAAFETLPDGTVEVSCAHKHVSAEVIGSNVVDATKNGIYEWTIRITRGGIDNCLWVGMWRHNMPPNRFAWNAIRADGEEYGHIYRRLNYDAEFDVGTIMRMRLQLFDSNKSLLTFYLDDVPMFDEDEEPMSIWIREPGETYSFYARLFRPNAISMLHFQSYAR